jgi:hypothetical protein
VVRLVTRRTTLTRILLHPQSVRAQSRLPEIQNQRRVTFAGAWTNYGFHEDGFTSGLKVAVDILGASCPFPIRPAARAIERASVARVIMSQVEAARRWMQGSFVWYYVAWIVVAGLVWLEQALQSAGLDRWAAETHRVRGFWVDDRGRPLVFGPATRR